MIETFGNKNIAASVVPSQLRVLSVTYVRSNFKKALIKGFASGGMGRGD